MKLIIMRCGLFAILVLSLTSSALGASNNWVDNGPKVYTNGFVGVGLTNPTSAFHLYPNAGAGINFRLYNYTYFGTMWSGFHTVIGGNVRASETSANQMEIANTHPTYGGVAIELAPDIGFIFHTKPAPVNGFTEGTVFNSPQMYLDVAGNLGLGTQAPAGQKVYIAGNETVTGMLTGVNANFTGTVTGNNIAATYQDLAEWVPASEHLGPGTVVVLSPSKSNQVMPSHTAYDTAVAGVVSDKPGITLGIPGQDKEVIATTGRVHVKVDASLGPVAIGDLLVTSAKRGFAMKSEPVKFGGIEIHRPGTIVGKALEALPSGQGEILVLLTLQ